MNDFWKTWNKKMYKNVNHDVYVNGSNDNATVGNAFLNHFNSIYYDSGEDTILKVNITIIYSSKYMQIVILIYHE